MDAFVARHKFGSYDLRRLHREKSWLLSPRYGTLLTTLYLQIDVVLDAKRLEDGSVICIKRIAPKIIEGLDITSVDEIEIGKYLSTETMLRDATNHCVPILESFRDPILLEVQYIVMPVLRPFDNPEFCFVGEVVEFVTQLLEVSIHITCEQPSHSNFRE
jgi:hypothetical protein